MLTCLCNVYPLTPHFYIVKLGFTGVYIFSYFCYVLSKNKKNITIFHLKIIVFTAVKNRLILHGHVFVMYIIRKPVFGTATEDVLEISDLGIRGIVICTRVIFVEKQRHRSAVRLLCN